MAPSFLLGGDAGVFDAQAAGCAVARVREKLFTFLFKLGIYALKFLYRHIDLSANCKGVLLVNSCDIRDIEKVWDAVDVLRVGSDIFPDETVARGSRPARACRSYR